MRPYPHEFIEDRYSPAYLLGCIPEQDVQAAILDLLYALRIFAMPVDAGAKTLRGRAARALRQAGADGRILAGAVGAGGEGFPDIIGTLHPGGRSLFIEVKRPKWAGISSRTGKLITLQGPGLPTRPQLAFLDAAHRAGALVGVAWSVDDVRRILEGP